MPDTSPTDLPEETIGEKAIAEIRRRWVEPTETPREFSVEPSQVDQLAKKTLDAMLVRRWRVTPLPPQEEYDQLLARVKHWVARGEPIRIMLGYAPMKNPKTVPHTHADWAEFFAFCHLCTWHNKVCTVYPPGVRIKIIFDDSTVRMANRYPKKPMNEFIRSVGQLAKSMKYESFIVGTMRQSSFAWLFNFGPYQLANRRMKRWAKQPENAEVVERMLEFSRRNLVVPTGLSEAETEKRFRDAAHRYRVYWEALQMSGFANLGNKLVAMYMDGNQHHQKQAASLHLATVGKEQVTQPWQGEGALRDNGKGKLVPLVLTAKRREELTIEEVDTSGLVPQEGFDTLPVCLKASV